MFSLVSPKGEGWTYLTDFKTRGVYARTPKDFRTAEDLYLITDSYRAEELGHIIVPGEFT